MGACPSRLRNGPISRTPSPIKTRALIDMLRESGTVMAQFLTAKSKKKTPFFFFLCMYYVCTYVQKAAKLIGQ